MPEPCPSSESFPTTIARILRPTFVALVTRNAAHGDRVQRGCGVEQRRASTGQVVRVLGTPVAGAVVVTAVVPRRHDEQHVELAAERIQCHGQSRHVPALVGFVQVPVGQIEDATAVVVDEVPYCPFDLVLDQLDVALVALVQNPAAEEPERRYEAALAKPLGHVVVESDAGYEGTVPLLIRSRRVPHEALRIADRGRQQRVTGNDSRVENRNSRRSVGWTRRSLERVNVREHQRLLEPDSRRQVQGANIPMAKQVFGQSTPTANPMQRQVGLAHRVENLSTALRHPTLERAAQRPRFIAPLQRQELSVHNEGFLIGKAIVLQCPAHPIVGGPAIDVLQRVQHLPVRNMLTGCKARESGFERCELLITGERQKQRILPLADHLDVAPAAFATSSGCTMSASVILMRRRSS